MPAQTVALVDKTGTIAGSKLKAVAAALAIQANQHLKPFWPHVDAAIVVLPAHAKVPPTTMPVYIGADLTPGKEGVHNDETGLPFAEVHMEAGDGWMVAVSHEVLEMLVDPTLRLTMKGPAVGVTNGRVHDVPGTFDYLVEVCDPSESPDHGYSIGGIPVSDFYTPHYFDAECTPGTRYSYTGALKQPRRIVKGGYLSWHHPDLKVWQQLRWIGAPKPTIATVDWTPPGGVLFSREHMDLHTKTSRMLSQTHRHHPLLMRAAKERGE
jgi:hypothetical protein